MASHNQQDPQQSSQPAPAVTLVIDGVQSTFVGQADVGDISELAIVDVQVQNGERRGSDLVLELATGDEFVLIDFFGADRELGLPVAAGVQFTIRSSEMGLEQDFDRIDFSPSSGELQRTDGLQTGGAESEFRETTPEFFDTPDQRLAGESRTNDLLGQPQQRPSQQNQESEVQSQQVTPPEPPTAPTLLPRFDSLGTFSAPENVSDTRVLHRVSTQDLPGVVYSLLGAGAALFEITPRGEISLRPGVRLDFETDASYTFIVNAAGAGGARISQVLSFSVRDLNDNTPLITSVDTANIAEDVSDTTVLHTVTASDADSTGEALVYVISEDTSNLFEIDSNTGEISLKNGASVDYEIAPNTYTVKVTVSDGINTSTEQSISFSVTDVNDSVPSITSASAVNIAEDVSDTSVLHTVTATDADGTSEILSYAISEDVSGLFEIDSASGEISLKSGASVDYEAAPNTYTVKVSVSDGSNTSVAQSITFTVTDVNDNMPSITSANSATIAEDASDTTVLHTVTATDADTTGESLIYAISEDASNLFEIDSSTGEVSLKSGASLDYETAPNSYTIKVTASDGSNTSAAQSITFSVTDVNDNAPVITSASSVAIDETSNTSTVLHTVSVTDADTTGSHQYSISNDANGLFAINTSGEITLNPGKALDFEAGQSPYTITVSVDDGVNSVATQNIVFTLNDLNDETPVVATQQVEVIDNVSDTDVITTVAFTDADASATNGTTTYAIVDDADNLFEINSSGEITLQTGKSLDYNNKVFHNITVTVNDGVNTSAKQSITILVKDYDLQNNLAPVVDETSSAATVAEDASGVLTTVVATDQDVSNDPFVYTLVNDDNGRFVIDSATGEISLASGESLDYEQAQSHTLQVKVFDGVNTSDVADVAIKVTDKNDEAPVLTSSDSAAVYEDVAAGTVLHTLEKTDADSNNGAFSYSIVNDPDNLFALDADTGEITLQSSKSFDYENASSHTLQVKVNDGVNDSSTQTITFSVSDRNDETPLITSVTSVSVDEGVADTAAIHTIRFTDNDAVNGTTSYAITEDTSNLFEIDSSGVISLKSGAALDYENATSHTIKVTVNDGANTSSEQTITINVNDVNDNAPTITSAASFSVDEDASVTDVLHTVTKSDADTDNGVTQFTITEDTSGLFEIDDNGQISLKEGASLDYETTTSYSIKVKVNDGVADSSVQTIAISVNDVNDNALSIISSDSATVAESLDADTTILDVNVRDLDTVGTLSFSIVEDSSNLFEIDSDGKLSLKSGSSLDYETATSHTVKVQASDGVHTTGSQTLTINVTDVNDTAPVITNASTATLNVDTKLQLTATDVDTSIDALIYRLSDDANGKFELNSDEEILIVGDVASGDYDVTVIANDGVNDSAPKTITITVEAPPLQNHAPEIDGNASAASVSELVDDSTVITTISATDAESDTISYALTDDANGLFEIDTSTGEVSLATGQSLDYETAQSHTIRVTATDGTDTSIATDVVITVEDANDNTPVITSGSTVTVAENATNTTVLYTVAFSDADQTNGSTSYSISDGPFMINNAGQIKLKPGASLDYESVTSYTAAVSVSDGANTSASQTITFNVSDVNDESPELAADTSLDVAEDVGDTSILYTLVSSGDRDVATTNGTTTYTLTDDAGGLFEVGSATGEISLAAGKSLNYETATSHTIKAITSDGANNSAEQTIVINVTAANDEVPVITSATGFSASEDVGDTSVLHTVTFSDSDTSDTGINTGTFTLTEDTSNLFQIDASSGEISLQSGKALDFENATHHTIKVKVNDGSNDSAIQTITISVTDVNDVAPTVTSAATFSADENVGVDEVLHTVTYSDVDTTNGTFSYSIAGDTAGLFEISTSGEISLQAGKSLDYETATSHTFDVIVDDGANISTQTLTLNVNNIDDEAPVFASTDYIQVLETLPAESAILDVDATDNTSDVLSYAITTNSSGLFAIDSATGQLTLATGQSLDYATAQQHQIVVTVTDAANNSSTQNIIIEVAQEDAINNVSPVILTGSASIFDVDEGPASGNSFGAVRLQDIDVNDSTFSFTLTDDAGGLFEIDSATGAIKVASGQSLDYETTTSYTLKVQASDGTNSSDITDITVNVNDIDDTAPEVVYRSYLYRGYDYSVDAENKAFVGELIDGLSRDTVNFLSFSSSDVETNRGRVFSIVNASHDVFEIDAWGRVSLKAGAVIDEETALQYSFDVRVTDQAGNFDPANDYSVTLNVIEQNDNKAVITSSDTITLEEGTQDGSVFHTATYTDADARGAYAFYRHAASGIVRSINVAEDGSFTFTQGTELTEGEYNLKIRLYDSHTQGGGYGSYAIYQDITIVVEPGVVNDFAPVITVGSETINERINEHSILHQVSFTDADDPGLAQNYTYSITSNPDAKFEIDEQGQITLKQNQSIDFSTMTSATIGVSVNDGEHTSSENITLNFVDTPQVGTIDVSVSPATNNTTMTGDGSSDSLGESAVILGDINGDGFDDYLLGARLGDSGGSDAGNAYVLFGSADGIGDLTEDGINGGDGSKGFVIYGRHSNDTLGNSVAGIGDINGDGYDDIALGARLAEDDSSNGKEGEAYVIYGQAGSFGSKIDFQVSSDYDGSGTYGVKGFEISGNNNYDYLGSSVAGVGDVNADGYDDFMVSATGANGYDNDITDAGEAILVYGKGTDFNDFFVSDVEDGTVNGIAFYGRDADDFLGSDENSSGLTEGINTIGDINGDGYSDFIISAKDATANATEDGEAYVVFGSESLTTFNLDTYTFDGGNGGFEINGAASWDNFGYSVSGGSDINGDGYSDFIIGAPNNDDNGTSSGIAYVFYGKQSGYSNIDLSGTLSSSDGFVIKGESAYDYIGGVVAMGGDVNGDGYDDLVIGNENDDEAYLIFGKAAGFGSELDLNSLNYDGTDAVKITGFAGDITAVSIEGDTNGDGYDDMVFGASGENQTWFVNGRDFSGTSSTLVTPTDIASKIETGVTGATDNFTGNASATTYNNIGTGDSVYAVAGDDTIAVSKNDFLRIDGGAGTDTLELTQSLDFTATGDSKIRDIEIISIGDSGAEITLGKSELINLSSSTDTIRIDGTDGQVNVFEDGFSQQADVTIDGTVYHVYTNGNATLQIQEDLFPNINVNVPTIDTHSFAVAEGGSIAITTAMLASSDLDTLITTDSDLSYTVSVTGGTFQLDGQDASAFTQQDVKDGKVTFVHDHSETVPAYSFTVSDGLKTSAAATGTFGFTQVNDNTPTLSNPAVTFKVDEATTVEASMFSISDADTDTLDSNLTVNVNDISQGEFRLNGTTATKFTLEDIKSGNVTYYNATEDSGTFNVLVSDGIYTSESISGTIEPAASIISSSSFEDGAVSIFSDASSAGVNFWRIFKIEEVGDVNSDGIDDFYIRGTDNGEYFSSIMFGSATKIEPNNLKPSLLDGTNGFKISTDQTDGTVGEVHGAGDINGDGIDDLVVFRNVNEIGSYLHGIDIIYGRTDWSGSSGDVDQRDYSDVFIKNGVTGDGYFEDNEIAFGDINNDGFNDISFIFEGYQEAFIIYGDDNLSNFTLKESTASSNGATHFDIPNSSSRAYIMDSGDYNGDGYYDFIIRSGDYYLVFGNEKGSIQTDISSLDGTDGVVFSSDDYFWILNSTSGDFNGDGYDDFFVYAESNNDYILNIKYGSATMNSDENITAPDGESVFEIKGDVKSSTVEFVGDINGDGYDDFLVGDPRAYILNEETNSLYRKAGELYVVFGREEKATIDLSDPDNLDGVLTITGSHEREALGNYTKALGDINGDGYDDFILTTTYGGYIFWGDSYVSGGTVGSPGDDTISGVGSNGAVSAGSGNDQITITTGDYRKVDGGNGIDTLIFGASDINLDLTNVSNLGSVENIEAINMGDGNGSSTLALNFTDVLALPSARDYTDDLNGGISTDANVSDILRVMGDSNDSVDLTDFADSGSDVTIDGIAFDLYTHTSKHNADILIEQGVNVI